MTVQIIRGNALDLPLADDSVDLVVTSPPYFGLRSYQDGGAHYDGQIGDEATPAEFVDALVAATREMVRVVKPSGSIFVNLGDKYAGSVIGGQTTLGLGKQRAGVDALSRIGVTRAGSSDGSTRRADVPSYTGGGARAKSLIGIPWRYALRCIDDLGLILRAEIIWSKPNGLPESVTDRVRRSHEQWFHFTLSPRYYSAVDHIREPHVTDPKVLARLTSIQSDPDGHNTRNRVAEGRHKMGLSPLGKLPGSVWTIPTEPLHVPESLGVDHFAAFPTEWPRRIVQGWSPAGICTVCGEGRRPVSERERFPLQAIHNGHTTAVPGSPEGRSSVPHGSTTTITGEACACPEPTAPTRPGVVLDPFGGTGTTALVADALGRHGISVDMSADYCRLAQWRTSDPKQQAKAARREYKPPTPQLDGQLDLLDLGGESA